MKRVSVLLITLALIAGMAACSQPAPPAEDAEIQTWYDLDDIRDNLGGSYILMNNLSAETAGYEELVSPDHNGGLGWEPIGTSDDRFIGSFDGQGYEISDLYINRPDEDGVGLFGYVQQGIVKNIGLVSVNVTGNKSVGALVGYSWKGTLDSDTRPPFSMTYSHGTVTGEEDVGGLVGNSYDGTVNQCESSAHVFHISSAPDEYRWRAGGLVGLNSGTVLNCDYNGEVNGDRQVGGLVGHNAILVALVEDCGGAYEVYGNLEVGGVAGRNMGSIRRASFAGEVNGILIGNGLVALNEDTTGNADSSHTALPGSYIGGVVGVNEGTLEDCSAEVTVSGYAYVGGLVGSNNGTVQNCVSDSTVTGSSNVGGLVGANRGSVGSCSSSGGVTGDSDTGCLVGFNTGTVSDSDSTSWVIGTSDGGDLVGRNEGVVSGVSYDLRVSSTSGGSVTTPGEGTFSYDYGAVVDLVAEAKEGYRFVNWSGDVDGIIDVSAASTTITMNGDYSITASFEEEEVHFPDANLEAAMREATDKPTGPIYRSDLEGLTHLDAHQRGITDLTGLEYCTNLIQPWLWGNQISDISPLVNLTSLRELWIDSNRVSDISALSNLTELTQLYLWDNQISDISPLVNLTNLTALDLGGNQIGDICPLVQDEGLGEGDIVYLWENPLSSPSRNTCIPELEARGVTVHY